MPFAWTLAKFLIKVVAPTVPEVVSTIAKLKKQQTAQQSEEHNADVRLVELEKTVVTQLQLIEHLTAQLEVAQTSATWALRFAIVGLLISLGILASLLTG
ncbi:MAG: hypothetical protein V3R16_05185 [Nitrospirales bacterium]